ncbi:TonB-dependent receptor plug domain-containing protein [Emticicia sp. CRIBPO]|uniref:TonB-dependent receptor n=1 Tax=Emticicia sp. CRIBPO TaxID=2683258 RepID=UPI0014122BAE|nr:TonB-dependent receptor [Emticicia sp. CRIBPO]NBA87419.1 TonB-dependent receptor plug domain-containing protein [Emticicia sp. CRIBPO]
MKNIKILVFILLASADLMAQNVQGTVRDKSSAGLPGVMVHWKGETAGTVFSDEKGQFSIAKKTDNQFLVFKMLGYSPDTVLVSGDGPLTIILKEETSDLNEVVVKTRASSIDALSPLHTEIINAKTLAKAACCNLSESFETNASVSVNYADAVTGSKQIQLLGLSGLYVQSNIENIPSIRGLASTFGLNFVPGTWIQSIDLVKGTGSVVNGFESMIGAMNVELQKPDNSEKLYLNIYANHLGRGEVNLNLSRKLTPKWSVGLLTHGSALKTNIDNNGDGFLDLPKYDQVNILNRWKYSGERFMAQFGVKMLRDTRMGGQKGFESRGSTPGLYGFTNKTNRVEFFSKTAKLFPEKPYRGLGLILNGTWHDSESYFGFKPYLATQKSFYSNLIYQDIFGTTMHTYKTGLSFQADNYDEKYGAILLKRNELIPGAFFEYTYNYLDKTVLVAGIRSDYHSIFGNQISPRIHFKQEVGKNDTWRVSFGKGFRVPNPLAEYFGNLVSSRQVVFVDPIAPEVSWSLGTSWIKNMGKYTISGELYHTRFEKQQIADMEHPGYIYFYGLDGKSRTTSALIELNYGPSNNWEFKAAYRFIDSKQTLGKPNGENVLVEKMFLNRDRVLLNAAYALPYDKWKFDLTLQWNGKRRIPNASPTYDHMSYQNMPYETAPAFANLNGQITRTFVNWDIYLGGENLTNFKQKNPIFDPGNPFGGNFDAGMAWGPVVGITVYSGVRYKIR